jgi:molecular chaperone GrpE (heat shock protein)
MFPDQESANTAWKQLQQERTEQFHIDYQRVQAATWEYKKVMKAMDEKRAKEFPWMKFIAEMMDVYHDTRMDSGELILS